MIGSQKLFLQNSRQPYLPHVDGLRAIAILAVVGYHVGIPGFSGGFVGVDVFFVISGYLITGLLVDEAIETGWINISAFYARRVRRLLPALFIVLLTTLLLSVVVLTPLGQQQDLAKSAIATATLSSNFYFWLRSGSYFEEASNLKPLLHTWTLAVEEQFYLCWPLLLIGLLLTSKKKGSFKLPVIIALLALLAISLGLSWLITTRWPAAAFYLLPTRAWEFALGGLLACVQNKTTFASRNVALLLSQAGLALIFLSVALLNDKIHFPGLIAIVPTLGAACVISSGRMDSAILPIRALASGPAVALGLLSYSWYLWHWPLLSFARAYELGEHNIYRDAAIAAIALAVAWLTYRLVENPIRFARPFPFDNSRTTLATGLVILLAAGGSGAALGIWARYAVTNVEPYRKLALETNAIMNRDWGNDRSVRCIQDKDNYNALPKFEDCLFGASKSNTIIVLWGDSHAFDLLSYLDEFGASNDVSILQRTFLACPPVIGFEPESDDTAFYGCAEHNRAVIDEIRHLSEQHYSISVLLAARWQMYFGQPTLDNAVVTLRPAVGDQQTVGPSKALQAGLSNTLSLLAAERVRALIVGPIPEFKYSVPNCIVRYRPSSCHADRSLEDQLRKASMEALRKATTHSNRVHLWDPISLFCSDETCESTRYGAVLFRDSNHLSKRGTELIGRGLGHELVWLLNR